jgi:hypothetical protein
MRIKTLVLFDSKNEFDLLVNHFKRGTSLNQMSYGFYEWSSQEFWDLIANTTVIIDKTPSINPPIVDGLLYQIPVSIYFSADIYS